MIAADQGDRALPGGVVPSGDVPFVELVDDVTHEAEVRRRVARRERDGRAGECATWLGVLQDLAERRVAVAVHLGGGRCHRGHLLAVARDHLVLAGEGACTVLLAMGSVRIVRPRPAEGRLVAHGDRPPAEDRTFLEALEQLLPTDPEVVVGLRDLPDTLRGTVSGLGEDVLTLRSLSGGVQVVPSSAIADVTWGS